MQLNFLNKRHSETVREKARELLRSGKTPKEVSLQLGVHLRTVKHWAASKKLYEVPSTKKYKRNPEDFERVMCRRFNQLAAIAKKNSAQLKEFEILANALATLRVDTLKLLYKQDGTRRAPIDPDAPQDAEQQEQRGKGRPPKAPKEKKIKNDISGITEEQIMQVLATLFFDYQRLWWEAKNRFGRNRFILKSRQIGATYYFAFEALADAILTCDNQIFLSASRDQAEVFKAYIIAFAAEHFAVELKGNVITLSNGAELRFLSTNSRTAQSYHGHLYVDECFWIPDFDKMWKVASGMASHKRWRRTLFSTPSSLSHQAYAMWSGDKYNQGLSEDKKHTFDISHATLKDGVLGVDKIWRHMVTVEDAEAQGCELFDIDELRTEYSTDDFANLFMCKFIDDAKSVFNLGVMMSCYAVEPYTDYQPKAARPFGNRPVALGYDPSRTRDNASLSILAIPLRPGDKWRVLHKVSFHGQNFQYQASRIKEMVDCHNVQHIGIDTSGIGYGLFELVEAFYRRATPINYSHETKTQLVMKAIDVIENGRFEYQAGDKEITQAFMMITKTTTGSGVITYASGRNTETGHADIAWSIMHALAYEPLVVRKRTTISISN